MPVTELELKSFTEFVSAQMELDDTLSLELCLDRWRAEQERAETIAAVKRGVADMEAGRFQTLEEFDAEFRKVFGLPPRTDYQTGGNYVCR